MSEPVIVGIDPSLTSTGVVLGPAPNTVERRIFGSEAVDIKSPAARIGRYAGLVAGVEGMLERYPRILAIFIEHYSFRSVGRATYTGEYGSLLRWHLLDRTPNLIEVSPATLKKFATPAGKKMEGKSQVIAEVVRRWDFEFDSDDEVDAYVLFRMGLVACGVCEADTKRQQEAVDTAVGDHQLVL